MPRDSAWAATRRHLVAGTAGGVVSIAVCHPFDTVRTRLQTAAPGRFRGALDCARVTVAREGARALYKGLLYPVCAQGFYKAVMFGAYGAAQRAVRSATATGAGAAGPGGGGSNNAPLSLPQLFFCGGFAGGVNAVVLTPIELVRNRLQVQYGAGAGGPGGDAAASSGSARRRYRGPNDVVARALREEGGARALWRGLGATLARDVPGVGCWYCGFEFAKRRRIASKQRQQAGASSAALRLPELMACGAFGGVCFWTVAFPFDTVKSVQQTARGGGDTDGGMLRVARALVREQGGGGVARLFRGFSSALVRGIPGAALVFSTYSVTMEWLTAAADD